MSLKSIIAVTPFLSDGGAERVMIELANEWSKQGNDVTIVVTNPNAYNESYHIDKRISLKRLPYRSLSLLGRLKSSLDFLRILKTKKDATVLAFHDRTFFIVGICSFFINNKIVFSERSDPNKTNTNKIKSIVRNYMFKRANYYVFQTQYAQSYYSKRIKDDSFIIPNPINPNMPEPYNGKRRKVIVGIGRFTAQKNFPLLLKAFSMLIKEHSDYVLEIYGRGGDEIGIKKLIDDLGLNNNVILMGFVQNIYDRIKDSTMYVSSSDFEGISNSMLEAMALGLPTVCTDCPVGGARLVIKNNINGLLIPVNDVESLNLAMKKIIENPDFAHKISEKAKLVRYEYPIDKISKKWLEIL